MFRNPELRRLVLLAAVVVGLVMHFRGGGGLPDLLPDNAPIDVDGLHVLVVYESAEKHRLTPGQIDVIDDITTAGELRKWLEEHGEVRVYVDDIGGTPPDWVKAALEKHDGTVPWMLIANSKSGYTGPVPDGVAATPELLKGYAE